eukprot:TRINITY_DN8935_c0_g1_i11.p1 TRINITY_DN8935_c0_g1~~TRINITY_DN8935_c0_g1_i11.p1  ORF type:complete len:102 (+),score=10.34 TRINITY_DN8935_c0_g1_i11:313-618(+)
MSDRVAISACDKGGQWRLAQRMFRLMLQSEVMLDAISHRSLISACEKGGQWQAALFYNPISVLVKRRSMAFSSKSSRLDAPMKGGPNVISYSADIRACETG